MAAQVRMPFRLVVWLPLLLVIACSKPQESPTLDSSNADALRFPNVRIAGPNSEPAPDGISVGRFVRDGNCLFFAVDGGRRYNPVIAGEASIGRASNGEPVVLMQGGVINLGQRIEVAGGGSGDVTNLSKAQRECSSSIFVMGEVLNAL